MIRLIIVTLSIAFVAENVAAFRPRIIKGNNANIEDYPYQVNLYYNFESLCGGSIISERHILTAAHCIFKDMVSPYDLVRIKSGTSYISGKGQFHEVSNITVHPNFSTDGNRAVNDIAVITLKNPMTFNKYQQKINLPEQNYRIGQKANVTGWGLAKQVPSSLTLDQLQVLETELISQEECQSKVLDPKNTIIYDTEICTARKTKSGVCHGDSGGPLASNGEVIGIVSWSDGAYCISKIPNVYTNVYKFKDFILSIINN